MILQPMIVQTLVTLHPWVPDTFTAPTSLMLSSLSIPDERVIESLVANMTLCWQ